MPFLLASFLCLFAVFKSLWRYSLNDLLIVYFQFCAHLDICGKVLLPLISQIFTDDPFGSDRFSGAKWNNYSNVVRICDQWEQFYICIFFHFISVERIS